MRGLFQGDGDAAFTGGNVYKVCMFHISATICMYKTKLHFNTNQRPNLKLTGCLHPVITTE